MISGERGGKGSGYKIVVGKRRSLLVMRGGSGGVTESADRSRRTHSVNIDASIPWWGAGERGRGPKKDTTDF